MKEIKLTYTLQNSSGVTKNWRSVVAKSARPCTGILGVREIEIIKRVNGAYFEEYRLEFEKGKGFIFLERLHKGGINGHHKTVKDAIAAALKFDHISVHFNPA